MKINLKLVVFIQSIIIIALISVLIFTLIDQQPKQYLTAQQGLLSSRIYLGSLEPKSNLMFNFNPLHEYLLDFIKSNKLNASIYVLNMRDGASFGIDADDKFEPASLNKLPTAIIILQKVELKELSLDTMLKIKPEFRDNRSGKLYLNPASEISVKDLLYYMLADSDNTAFLVLNQLVSLEDLQKLTTYTNYYDEFVFSKPNKLDLKITPHSTSNLFLSLYLSTILEPKHSEMILLMLTNNSFNIKEFAKLPSEVVVAHKFGVTYSDSNNANNADLQFNDCGILYIGDSRIFYCIMANNLEEGEISSVFGTIVSNIYKYVVETKQADEELR